MSDPNNFERAQRIPPTLVAYVKATGDGNGAADETTMRDLLADLMHYSEQTGIDFDQELRVARHHYEHESAEEGEKEPKPDTTQYHVAWSAQTNKGGESHGDIAIEIAPHIHLHNLIEVRGQVASHVDAMLARMGVKRTGDLVLTSVTRL